jgi:hypothetical protein
VPITNPAARSGSLRHCGASAVRLSRSCYRGAGGRKPSCDQAALAVVRQGLQELGDARLAELGVRRGQRRGLRVRVSIMSRLLTRLGRPRPPPSLPAAELDSPRLQQARTQHWPVIGALDVRRLQYVEASGRTLPMSRRYDRALNRERVVGSVFQNYSPTETG